MLEDDYSRRLDALIEACECDLEVPAEWEHRLAQRGVIEPTWDDQRSYVRHHFNGRAILEFDQTFASIPREHTVAQVITRDISRGGIAFLSAHQLFPGERISLWLSIGKRTFVVQRCVEQNDRCFEIGAYVAADEPTESTTNHPEAADHDQ